MNERNTREKGVFLLMSGLILRKDFIKSSLEFLKTGYSEFSASAQNPFQLNTALYTMYTQWTFLSETIRVTKQTKEALLRVAARFQEEAGRRIDFDEAINRLVMQEEKKTPDSFLKFVGSVRGVKVADLLEDLRKERKLDELRAKRKFST